MAQYGIKEVMNFTMTNYHRDPYKRRPIVYVDYAQITSMEIGAERHVINGGRGNGALLSFDHTKTARFNLTLPLVDLKMLALISGDKVEQKIREIYMRDELLIQEEKGEKYVKLTRKPVANSIHLYNLDNCRDFGQKICPALQEGSVQLEEGQFIVDKDDPTKLILHEDHAPETDTMIAYYHYRTEDKVTSMRINPRNFPKAVSFYGDALWRDQCDECDEVYHVIGHKGKLLPNYELSMSGTDSAVLELTLEMYSVNDPTDNTPVYIEYIRDEIQDCYDDDEDECEVDDDGEIVPPVED